MSQESNFSDEDIAHEPSVESPAEAPSGPPPPVSTSAFSVPAAGGTSSSS
ncbi:MAG: hypothetical protein L0H57_09270 [Yaniella sp.]|nr:hypothetical protein [Yaniella sp.]